MTHEDVMNLCFSCLMGSASQSAPITREDAQYTLDCWHDEGGELAEDTAGLTADELMEAWNELYDTLCEPLERGRDHELS